MIDKDGTAGGVFMGIIVASTFWLLATSAISTTDIRSTYIVGASQGVVLMVDRPGTDCALKTYPLHDVALAEADRDAINLQLGVETK